MKFFFFIYTLLSIHNLFGQTMQMKHQDLSQKKMQEQNVEIATLAAQAMSKNLPQKIDKYTLLQSVTHNNATLIYTFLINDATKSDTVIQKKDHSKMQKAVTQGVCQSSKRFLQAGINISYIYKSAKSKKLLFRFDITKDACNYSAIK